VKECGHTFCDECIKTCLDLNPSCPHCRVAATGSNPVYVLREVIEAMPVHCPEWKNCDDESSRKKRKGSEEGDDSIASASGCVWKGRLKDLKDHEDACDFKVVACSVEGCEYTCKRKDMESHLSSGVGMMIHMDLRCKNRMEAMEQKYDGKMNAMEQKYEGKMKLIEQKNEKQLKGMKSELRMEMNHQRYVNDCRSWIEYKRGDILLDISIYQVRRPDVCGNPISGLLCIFLWERARYPMMLRYESAYKPPTCKFPLSFFHLNICPTGSLPSQDYGWTAETSLSEILTRVQKLLTNPNPNKTPHYAIASGVYRQNPSHYRHCAKRQAKIFSAGCISMNPKVKEMLGKGEKIDKANIMISNCKDLCLLGAPLLK